MIDYKTESEAATPRLCLQFSEPLSPHADRFHQVSSPSTARTRRRVTVENEQLCIEGLDPRRALRGAAARRASLRRRGKPAEEHRDRRLCARPQAVRALLGQGLRAAEPRPAGHPARHRQHRRRSRSRSIASATAASSARCRAATSSASSRATRSRPSSRAPASASSPASMDVPQKLNEDVTTALPVTDAVGVLKPGVYVMIAKPTQKKKEEYNSRGDAVVHRLRPRPHRLLRR